MAKQFICRPDYPVVSTKHGKLRGFVEDGTFKFYGIKYADAERWEMPHEVQDWDGIKDALGYGYVCPMLTQDKPGSGEMKVPHRYWPLDENCQYLNVWTRSIENVKKAVIVWIHGGGFTAGSGIEQVSYDGTNLTKYGDVVVVSLNHRLNILGYLDLSAYGEKYWNSANVGNADLVAALQWVHDNIANFGGDPENVTIMGQSGGGVKVCTMMQTPAADGLFHKAIIMSGARDVEPDCKKDSGKAIAEALLKETGCKTVEEMAVLPYSRLAEAYNKVSKEVAKDGTYIGANTPMANSWYTGNPLLHGWTEHSKQIPLLIGTVLDEFKAFAPGRADRWTMSEEEAHAMVEQAFGAEADHAIELFRKNYPGKNLCDLCAIDTFFRPNTIRLIATKSECTTAPVYAYQFTYEFPMDAGSGPWHCSDIPFAFHNTELVPVCNIPGVSDELEHRYCAAFTNFAKYGDPNDASLPEWPACTPGDEASMIFDRTCEVRHNHDHELVQMAVDHGKAALNVKIEH